MNKFISYFGTDGLLHILANILIVNIFDRMVPLFVAIIIAAAISVLKELLWDKYLNRGTCEKKNIIADTLGIILGCI